MLIELYKAKINTVGGNVGNIIFVIRLLMDGNCDLDRSHLTVQFKQLILHNTPFVVDIPKDHEHVIAELLHHGYHSRPHRSEKIKNILNE